MQKSAGLSKILTQLENYEVSSLLGSGSYGEVYRACPKNSEQEGQDVAIKIEKSRFS